MNIKEVVSQKLKRQEELASAKENIVSKKNKIESMLEKANDDISKSNHTLDTIKMEIDEIMNNRRIVGKELLKNIVVLLAIILITSFTKINLPLYVGLLYTGLKIPKYIKFGKNSSITEEKRLIISESSEILKLYDLEERRCIIQNAYQHIKCHLENIETEEKVNRDIIAFFTESINDEVAKKEEKSSIIDLNEVRRTRNNPNIKHG